VNPRIFILLAAGVSLAKATCTGRRWPIEGPEGPIKHWAPVRGRG
jgi:hypothetical protein